MRELSFRSVVFARLELNISTTYTCSMSLCTLRSMKVIAYAKKAAVAAGNWPWLASYSPECGGPGERPDESKIFLSPFPSLSPPHCNNRLTYIVLLQRNTGNSVPKELYIVQGPAAWFL